MQLTAKAWSEYAVRLSRLNETAGRLMQAYIARYGTEDSAALIAYASALVSKYGEGSAELACQMYDAMADLAGQTLPAAEPVAPAAYGEVAKAVNGTKHSLPLLRNAVSRLVKQAGADTTLHNALRDGAEFAWVPHGDTCPFCIMLASRGWQRASKKALKNGHAEHIHANCDCTYAIRFNSTTSVAGYDPERYLAAYEGAEGATPQEKLNAMRRTHYEANQGKITAQKRAAYLERKRSTGKEKTVKIELNNDKYIIDEPKISKFLLKPGAKHSAEFFDVGYSVQDEVQLNADIYRQFDESQKVDVRVGEDGTERFSIFMNLGTDQQKRFRTVWQRRSAGEKPRLITAHREAENNGIV